VGVQVPLRTLVRVFDLRIFTIIDVFARVEPPHVRAQPELNPTLFPFRLSAAEYLVQSSATDLFNRPTIPGRVPAELRSRVSPEPSDRRGIPDLFDDSAARECDESGLFDPSIPGRYVAVAVGAASLGVLVIVRALRAKQAQFADTAAEADPAGRALRVRETRRVRPRGLAAAAAPAIGIAGLLLVAGSLIGYQNQTSAEQAHVDRAQQVQAHVATYADGDYRQVFAVENGPRAGERVPMEVAEELGLGSDGFSCSTRKTRRGCD